MNRTIIVFDRENETIDVSTMITGKATTARTLFLKKISKTAMLNLNRLIRKVEKEGFI